MKIISKEAATMYGASWSGGKDSCLACYLAMQKGFTISHLVHFDRPFNLHGVDPAMIKLQTELVGIPLVQRKIASEDFEEEFKDTVGALIRTGVNGMVFGDIYLEPHKKWVDRVCGELGIVAEEPLWGMNTEKIMKDFLSLGFETIIVSGQKKIIDKKWMGRKMDGEFIEYLKERGLDVCGENGEFHTFVTSGPLFKGKIDINRSETVDREGFWFFDVKEYSVLSLDKK
jgi:diphthine-ammonia ligase